MKTVPSRGDRSVELALLAAALLEVCRPIFTRWADAGPKATFERLRNEIRDTGTLRAPDTDVAEIEALPEFSYEDSDHRDYFVMSALGIVYYALLALVDHDSRSAHLTELETVTNFLLLQLGAAAEFASIRELVQECEAKGSWAACLREADARMAPVAQEVMEGMIAAAQRHGWPPSRVVRPSA